MTTDPGSRPSGAEDSAESEPPLEEPHVTVDGGADAFDALAATKTTELLDLLSERPSRWWMAWRMWIRDPELLKLRGKMLKAIGDAQRLADTQCPKGKMCLGEAGRRRATRLLAVDPRALSLDAAVEHVDAWERLVVEHADRDLVAELLLVEQARDRQGTSVSTWSVVFPGAKPSGLESLEKGAKLSDELIGQGKQQLLALYRTRAVLYQLQRARTRMKARFLLLISPLLTGLVAFSVILLTWIFPTYSVWLIPMIALSGALGATISGTYKLRDQVQHINVLRDLWSAFPVQALFGATAGLFLFLIVESGLISFPWSGDKQALLVALAFVAGFSEPFFLGTIGRVAGIAEERHDSRSTSGDS